MGRIIGIDLGTTNSVVAIVDMGGGRVIQNKQNEHQTRSVVTYNKGEFLVGTPAIRRWLINPKETITSIKRLVGRGISDPEVEMIKQKKLSKNWIQYEIVQPTDGTKDSIRVKLGGKEYSPVQISAKILEKLKKDAEFALGDEVTHAVITVPAYFSDKQRNATREAGLLAGLTVMKILDEPTAAAIAFGIDSREQDAKTILVFDLGGGTFDISVLMMAAGAFSPLNLEGDMWLGGDDFDELIVDEVLQYIKKEYSINPQKNDRFMASLKNEAQKAKESLSSSRIAEIIIPGMLQDNLGNIIDIEIDITRELFEEKIIPLLNRIESLVKKAVKNANFEIEDIDYVLMAGNSSAIPKVQELVEKMFGADKMLRKIHPKQSVAIGAAMAAAVYGAISCPKCSHNNPLDAEKCEKCDAELSGIEEKKNCPNCGILNSLDNEKCSGCDAPFIQVDGIKGGIAPFNYGVQTSGDKFNIFIRKGDPFPTPEEDIEVQTFKTTFPNQRIISVPVYGGNDETCASNNEKQGEAFSVLPPDFPINTPIKVKMWLDADGAFMVDNFLDNGEDIEDLILRGEKDQKAVEALADAEKKIAANKNFISQAQADNIEIIRNDVLKRLDKKDFAGAQQKADELMQEINTSKEVDVTSPEVIENIISLINFIINTYNWLLGQEAYNLQNMVTELEDLKKKQDNGKIKIKVDEINKKLDVLTKNTTLGILINIRLAIINEIQKVDSVKANQLLSELQSIELDVKNNKPNASSRINVFVQSLNIALAEARKNKPQGKKCSKCGHNNPAGIKNCESCGFNLWILN